MKDAIPGSGFCLMKSQSVNVIGPGGASAGRISYSGAMLQLDTGAFATQLQKDALTGTALSNMQVRLGDPQGATGSLVYTFAKVFVQNLTIAATANGAAYVNFAWSDLTISRAGGKTIYDNSDTGQGAVDSGSGDHDFACPSEDNVSRYLTIKDVDGTSAAKGHASDFDLTASGACMTYSIPVGQTAGGPTIGNASIADVGVVIPQPGTTALANLMGRPQTFTLTTTRMAKTELTDVQQVFTGVYITPSSPPNKPPT